MSDFPNNHQELFEYAVRKALTVIGEFSTDRAAESKELHGQARAYAQKNGLDASVLDGDEFYWAFKSEGSFS